MPRLPGESEGSRGQGGASVGDLREASGVERIELTIDVEHHDAHDEDADEDVEQHAELEQEGDALGLCETEEVDPVFEHEITHDLRDGLAPARHDDESDHHG